MVAEVQEICGKLALGQSRRELTRLQYLSHTHYMPTLHSCTFKLSLVPVQSVQHQRP